MLRIGVGLGNILALAVEPFQRSTDSRVEHLGNAQSGFRVQPQTPGVFKLPPNRVVADRTIAGKFMREIAHVAGTLHVVLAS